MNHGSLFSGIGGFDLAAQWMGWNNVFHCEINQFGRKVLNYYWPESISYEDITKTDFTIHRRSIDILTGGFPCQPFSVAGKRKGTSDHRNLWPEYYRAIKEIRPRWVVGENVPGIINWSDGVVFEQVQSDLENEGYEVWANILPAAGVNAPHKRDRVWFIAHSNSNREVVQRRNRNNCNKERNSMPEIQEWENVKFRADSSNNTRDATDSNSIIRSERRLYQNKQKKTERYISQFDSWTDRRGWENFPTQSPICGGNDGIPRELDGITFSKWRNESIKAYGNAIVPQVVFQIFQTIQEIENL